MVPRYRPISIRGLIDIIVPAVSSRLQRKQLLSLKADAICQTAVVVLQK